MSLLHKAETKELIVFGRSPFINTIDVPRLLHHKTLGLNAFAQQWPVNYSFSFDHYLPAPGSHVFYSRFCTSSDEPGTPFIPKPSETPLLEPIVQDGMLCLGFRCFTVTSAVNWAIMRGFKKIYLVGVDHVETDSYFKHYDGLSGIDRVPDGQMEVVLTPDSHRQTKEFIYACAGHADIFQCNPAVKDDWRLPYQPIEELYR